MVSEGCLPYTHLPSDIGILVLQLALTPLGGSMELVRKRWPEASGLQLPF